MNKITLKHKTNPDVTLEIRTNRPDLISDIVKGVSNSFEDYEVVVPEVEKPKVTKSKKKEEIERLVTA